MSRLICLLTLTMVGWAGLSGCALWGSASISGLKDPLDTIKVVIRRAAPNGIRKVSINGREVLSNYFSFKGKRMVASRPGKKRYFARFVVLGAQRPYRVRIIGFAETPTPGGGYASPRPEPRLSKLLVNRFTTRLSKRRKQPKSLDDFKAF